MMLVWTSTVAYEGEDRFDITRKSGGRLGTPFAPPEHLFLEMVKRRRELQERRAAFAGSAMEAVRLAWEDYAAQYVAAMRLSQKTHPDAWTTLLGKSCVTLVCYCEVPSRCHRQLLAKLLEGQGATLEGER